MNPTELDVARFAHLARLALGPDESARLRSELERILAHFATLAQRSDRVVAADPPCGQHGWRGDVVAPAPQRDALLANAPALHDAAFSVPRVIE